MLQEITRENLRSIRNSLFRNYAGNYLDIYDDFISQVEQFGLPFDREENYLAEADALISELSQRPDVITRCENASLVYGHISTACEACRKGVGTITEYISFRCHRKCFFCFNPNQDNYESHLTQTNDCKGELDRIKAEGGILTHIALTGGEPLLFPDETVDFFAHARALYPDAHLRLYTSGDLLNAALLERLRDAGLDEIRFSFKMEDPTSLQQKVLANMALAKKAIPDVMVEMPVMPDCLEKQEQLLDALDEIGIRGINLLELCFPYNNPQAFSARGFKLKYPPYRTLYNFWYAGGLPVAGSETAALKAMKYAAGKGLKLGIHYCSLENKNFGQIYHQNHLAAGKDPTMYFSDKDFYLKTLKAFGTDAAAVKKLFDKRGITDYRYDPQQGFIGFHPKYAHMLKGRVSELALSVNVMEDRGGETVTRELKLMLTGPDLKTEDI